MASSHAMLREDRETSSSAGWKRKQLSSDIFPDTRGVRSLVFFCALVFSPPNRAKCAVAVKEFQRMC